MKTLSFKAQDELLALLTFLAQKKGINLSALIKLLLNQALNEELSTLTPNGMTLAEEFEILESDLNDEVSPSFNSVDQLKKALLQ